MTGSDGRWLEGEEAHAWRAFVVGQALLFGRLNKELQDGHGLALADYEIFVRLSEQPDHRMRMSVLADEVVASKSRLSHQIARLEAHGLVRREVCDSDGRGVFAVLTDAGFERLRVAAPDHVDSVREHFVDLLDPDDRRLIGDVFDRLVAKLRP